MMRLLWHPTVQGRLDALRALLQPKPLRSPRLRAYDDHQAAAVLVSWRCCRRTVWSTHPAKGCLLCRS